MDIQYIVRYIQGLLTQSLRYWYNVFFRIGFWHTFTVFTEMSSVYATNFCVFIPDFFWLSVTLCLSICWWLHIFSSSFFDSPFTFLSIASLLRTVCPCFAIPGYNIHFVGCCVRSYHNFHTRIFRPIKMIKPLNKI